MFCHWSPQMAVTMTMGSSSLIVMCRPWNVSGHLSWNQNELKKEPHPQVPEASDVSEISGWNFLSSIIIDRPFHCSMKQCHHMTSDWACLLRRIKTFSCQWLKDFSALIRCLIKVRPDRTTMLASCSRPMSDSSCFRLQNLNDTHFCIVCLRR